MRIAALASLSSVALAALAVAASPPVATTAVTAPTRQDSASVVAAAAKAPSVKKRLKTLETLVDSLNAQVEALSAQQAPFTTTHGTFQVVSLSESNVTFVDENLLLGDAFAATAHGVLTLAATVRASFTYTGSNGSEEIQLVRVRAFDSDETPCHTRRSVNGAVTATEKLTCSVVAEPGDTFRLKLFIHDFSAGFPDIDVTSTAGNGVWIFQAADPQPVALP